MRHGGLVSWEAYSLWDLQQTVDQSVLATMLLPLREVIDLQHDISGRRAVSETWHRTALIALLCTMLA